MSAAIKPLEATLSLRNNAIKKRRTDLGMTQKQLGIAAGVSTFAVCGFETMNASPFTQRGWIPTAIRLAEYFDVDPSELFPGVVLAIEHNSITRELNELEASRLISDDTSLRSMLPDDIIEARDAGAAMGRAAEKQLAISERKYRECSGTVYAHIPRRNAELFEMHLDGATVPEMRDKFGIGRERINQIIDRHSRALRYRYDRERINQ